MTIRKLSLYSNNSMCDMIDAEDQEEDAQMRKASQYISHNNAGVENFTNFLLSNMIEATSDF